MIPALTDQKFQRHTSSPSHITNMTYSSYWLSHIEGNEVIEGVCGETRHDGCKYFATQSDFSTWTPQIWCWLGYLFVYLCGKPWLSIYEISPKAAQRVTKQDPKSVTEAWLCNAAQSSRTNPILRVGFLLFLNYFPQPEDTTEGQLWLCIRTQTDTQLVFRHGRDSVQQ